MEPVSAKVLGTVALVLGLGFLVTVVVRLVRADLDLLQIVLNSALSVLWLGAGIWLWRFALRETKRDR